MTDQGDLESLRGLHQDLVALNESRLQNIDKLWADLEERVTEFQRLLDKSPKSEARRKELLTGMFISLF